MDLTKPGPRFHYTFLADVQGFSIWPEHIFSGQDLMTFKNNPPVTTSVWKFKEALVDQRMFIWERDENYWGKDAVGMPAAKYIIYRNSPDSPDVDYQLFMDAAVDHAHHLEWLQVQQAEQENDKVSHAIMEDPCPRNIYFNNQRYPFTEPGVRQAINMILPRETIANVIWRPPTAPALHPWSNWPFLEQFLFDDVLQEYAWAYNPEVAAAKLDELGFVMGDNGVRVDPEGNPMSYTIITNRPIGGGEYQIAQALADEAAKVGIEMQVRFLEGGAFWDPVDNAEYDMASAWLCGAFLDPVGLYDAPNGDLFNAHFESEELAAAYETIATNAPDSEAARAGYRQALTVLMRDVPTMPVIQTATYMPWNETYWTGFPTTDDLYIQPFSWWSTFYLVPFELQAAQ